MTARYAASGGLILGLAALALQASLTFPASMAEGRSLLATTVFFFSFFTILTNTFLVLVYVAAASPDIGWLNRLRHRPVIGFGVLAITLVMLTYHFVLADTWSPQGLWWVADMALHYVTPVCFLIWWAATIADGSLRADHIWRWLAVATAYIAYIMARGALTGEYPYPIFDAGALGYPAAALNLILMLASFLVLGGITVVVDRLIGRWRGIA